MNTYSHEIARQLLKKKKVEARTLIGSKELDNVLHEKNRNYICKVKAQIEFSKLTCN